MAKQNLGIAPASASRSPKQAKAPEPNLPPVRPGFYQGDGYCADESIGYLTKQVVELISRSVEARMAEYSLTDAQWKPLFFLARHGHGTASQVARKVGCDAGATTRMLDRLEDKGLLRRVRSIDDRRVQQLELTDEGRKAAAIVPYVLADVLNAHLSDLSNAEVDQLRGLLERVIATGRRLNEGGSRQENGA